MSTLTRCDTCGRSVDAVQVWFHPGTGQAACETCHARAHDRHAQLTALRGEYR